MDLGLHDLSENSPKRHDECGYHTGHRSYDLTFSDCLGSLEIVYGFLDIFNARFHVINVCFDVLQTSFYFGEPVQDGWLPITVTNDLEQFALVVVVVLDVGISRTDTGLVGDVDPSVMKVAAFVAPMPGGVGPMTRAMLLTNVVDACER